MINAREIISMQLEAAEKAEVALSDGSRSVLTPVRYAPQLADGGMRISLNGQWKVARWPFDLEEAKLAAPDCDDASWPAVAQPGKVFYADPEEHSAAVENWNRVTLEHIDPDDGAVVRRWVQIPPAWQGKHVFLRFDAVYPAARFYCNGAYLGEHLSGLTPVEWDVTDTVQPGTAALVAVRLIRKHRYVRLDMPRHAMEFTGISQDAYLHAAEHCRIVDYYLVAELDDSYRDGTLAGQAWLRNETESPRHCRLIVSLADQSGREAAQFGRDLLCAGAGDPWGWTRWGEDADWGVVTAELLPKPHFWAMRVIFSPVQFPQRLNWQRGQTQIAFDVHNGYNSIDLSRCTLRTMWGMATMREWKNVPIACPPGRTATVRIPIWNEGSIKSLERGSPAVCRCILLGPGGYRPITADILVVPEKLVQEHGGVTIAPEPSA